MTRSTLVVVVLGHVVRRRRSRVGQPTPNPRMDIAMTFPAEEDHDRIPSRVILVPDAPEAQKKDGAEGASPMERRT